MTDVDTRKGLELAVEELKRLHVEREHIEVEIARQQRKVAAWAELCDDSTYADPFDLGLGGLTEACTTVLRGARKEWMNTTEIMSGLRELGFALEKYKAPMASITTTVNRMVDSGEVVSTPRTNPGATEYKWVGKMPNFAEQLSRYVIEASQTTQRTAAEIAHAQKNMFGKPKVQS
jgi:hypothetical protein